MILEPEIKAIIGGILVKFEMPVHQIILIIFDRQTAVANCHSPTRANKILKSLKLLARHHHWLTDENQGKSAHSLLQVQFVIFTGTATAHFSYSQ